MLTQLLGISRNQYIVWCLRVDVYMLMLLSTGGFVRGVYVRIKDSVPKSSSPKKSCFVIIIIRLNKKHKNKHFSNFHFSTKFFYIGMVSYIEKISYI